MRNDHVMCLGSAGYHRMHYTEWGDAGNPRIVVCVHGLTRNGRDFDFLAQALAPDCRVICPDVAGRGRSDWLRKKADYNNFKYAQDMTALIARVTAGCRVRTIDWVGTSMGGVIGMLLASQPGTPISRLVLNDVGAALPKAALERLATYVGKDPRFRTRDDFAAYVRTVSAPFGPLTDAQWQHFTRHVEKEYPDGSRGFSYDPGVRIPFGDGPYTDIDLWSWWDAISCPTLLLRGAESDLLPREIALAMTQRGPRPGLVEFPGVGHAPALMSDDQIAVVREFLLAT